MFMEHMGLMKSYYTWVRVVVTDISTAIQELYFKMKNKSKYNTSFSSIDERHKGTQESLDDAQHIVSQLTIQLDQLLENIPDILQRSKDSRKLKLYAIYTSNKKLTYQEMANEIGISLRTVKYWIQGMKDQGLIS